MVYCCSYNGKDMLYINVNSIIIYMHSFHQSQRKVYFSNSQNRHLVKEDIYSKIAQVYCILSIYIEVVLTLYFNRIIISYTRPRRITTLKSHKLTGSLAVIVRVFMNNLQ